MRATDGVDGRKGRPPALFAGLVLAGLAAGFAAIPVRAEGPEVSECEARFAAAPEAEASSLCFLEAARASKAEAVRHVEDLLRLHPRNGWLAFYLGSLLWDEPARSSALYAQAADLLHGSGQAYGEVRACSNLYIQLLRQDRREETEAVASRATRVAESSGDRLALIRARILQSTALANRNQDLPQAYRLLRDARSRLTPADPYPLRRDCLIALAGLAMDLRPLDEARRAAEEAVALTGSDPGSYADASARYYLLRATREQMYLLPRPGDRDRALDLARETLAVAEASGHREVAGKVHGILGLLTAGPESELHFQSCSEMAEILKDRSYCRSLQARRLAAEDPRRALRLVDEALDLAREADSPSLTAYAWRERMRIGWQLEDREQAFRESLTALDAIELLRDLQAPTEGRAEVFATWASHYHWLAGRLLENAETGRAFEVQERMRARALVDSLRNEGAAAAPQAGFATLDQVRQALAPDEALLSFQIAPWKDMVDDFAGGAWLTVVTRDGATVRPLRSPLAERTRLRPAVEIFSGLFVGGGGDAGNTGDTGDTGDAGDAAAALYHALLADGLAGLGPGIRRLVIVPDDVLHLLPFAALRPAPDAAPLASRYEITLTPSATLWLGWRQEDQTAGIQGSALVLANPDSTFVAPAALRSAAFAGPRRLGPLPWAQREGEAVLRHLGGDSRLLAGPDATEAYLKKGPAPYGILHFATHAWTSDNEPDRSFVLLAPGSSHEDGRLHPGEIAGIDLRGRIVVLSTCSSAAGEILRGEGVMGLARAFFQARAHTVVATLWPLRDDYGAELFDRLYDHLGDGMSVAAALHAAQQDLMADGRPPAAWAGVVVLGDGSRVPVPGGRRGLPGFAIPLALAAGALAVLLPLARRRVRK